LDYDVLRAGVYGRGLEIEEKFYRHIGNTARLRGSAAESIERRHESGIQSSDGRITVGGVIREALHVQSIVV
jgi:hypothetical protein